MNIIILTDPFGKPLYVPRVRYLADYLVRQGHQVCVFSENIEPINFTHNYQLHTWRFVNSPLDWAVKSFLSLITDYKSRWFTRKVSGCINQYIDCIIVSTSYTFPLNTALTLAKHHNAKLLVDLRDVTEQAPNMHLISHRQWWLKPFAIIYDKINIKRRNRVLRQANAITTISPWHRQFLSQFNNNVHLIYNGFDRSEFYPVTCHTDTFNITYTGKLYSASLRNPQLLFEAVQILKNNIPEMQLHWYIDDESRAVISSFAKQYDIPQLIHLHDYVPRSQINDILNQSSIILVLGNKSTPQGPHGIMTTKFFEALGAKRPILVVRSDEDCLEHTVIQTNAGCAARNINDVVNFISGCYEQWKNNNGYIIQNNKSGNYDREILSQQFLHVIQQLFD